MVGSAKKAIGVKMALFSFKINKIVFFGCFNYLVIGIFQNLTIMILAYINNLLDYLIMF